MFDQVNMFLTVYSPKSFISVSFFREINISRDVVVINSEQLGRLDDF